MRKMIKIAAILCFSAVLLQLIVLMGQNHRIKDNLIRLHVVANSNEQYDQDLKLIVKDEIVSYLQSEMQNIESVDRARSFLKENLERLQVLASQKIISSGYSYPVEVSLEEESFGRRDYETFSLPAGVYESLRIKIGSGEGRNWWCVTFPSLCVPATGEDFVTAAVSNGFDEETVRCFSDPDTYRFRFFLLEQLGKLEIFLKRK